MSELKNKTVVITGGTQGIGLEIVKKFLINNNNVFVGSRSESKAFKKECSDATFVKTDVKKISDIENLMQTASKATGNIDVLINNAGISIWKKLENVNENFFYDIIDTNLKGTVFCCKSAAKQMKNKGIIVNIASLAGKRGSKNNSIYVASKFAVVGVTQALAKELGVYGIRVNSICPVYIDTPSLLSNLSGDHPEVGDLEPSEFLKQWGKANSALQRLPSGSECADACYYLASDSSSAITGQNINVDCGVLPQ